MQRQGQFQHPRPHAAQVRGGVRQHGIGLHAALQHVTELARVEVAPQTPVGLVAPGQAGLEEVLELAHGRQGRLGRAPIGLPKVVRRRGADGFVHQIEIPLVLFHRHAGPDSRRGGQVAGGLIEVERHLLEARDDAPHAGGLVGIFQNVGREQRVAQRFHVDGGVVLIAVDRVQIEQRERDLVLDDAQVGAILRAHPPRVQFAQTRLKALVKAPLLVQALRTHIVQEIVQLAAPILVQSHAGRRRRSEGKRGENEFVGETARTPPGSCGRIRRPSGAEQLQQQLSPSLQL